MLKGKSLKVRSNGSARPSANGKDNGKAKVTGRKGAIARKGAAPIRWFDGQGVPPAILDSERRFREIINALPAAVYTTDTQGRITHFNQHCVELSGRTPKLGSDRWCVTWKLYYPDGRRMPHGECPMAVALKTGRVIREAEAIAERPDGTRVWFTAYPTPLHDLNGRVIGAINMLVDITAKKTVEAELAARKAEVDLIITKTPFMLTRCSKDLRYRYVSLAYADMVGFTPEHIGGKKLVEIMGKEGLATIRPYVDEVLKGKTVSYESNVSFATGRSCFLRAVYVPDRNEKGDVVGWFASLADITDRKKAEALLTEGARQREALLQFVQRRGAAQTVEEIYTVGLDVILQILRCNCASILLFDDKKLMRFAASRGLSDQYRKTMEGPSPWKTGDRNPRPLFIGDVVLSNLAAESKKAMKREGIRAAAFIPLRAENRLIGKFVMYYNAPHQFTDEEMNISLNIAGQLGLGIERKRAENALRTSEERHRSIIKQSIAGIAETDLTGRFQVINDRYCEITGYSRDELLRLRMQDITDKNDLPENLKRFKQCAQHGTPFEIEKRYIRKDGTEVVVHNSVSAVRDSGNRVHGIVAVCIDITDRRRAEEALRESEEQMRATVEQAVAGMARSDRNGRIVFANKRFCELVGYSESELVGQTASQFTHPADMEKTADRFKQLVKQGKSFELEKRYIRKDGTVIWVNVSASPIRDATGKAYSAVAVVVDITDRKMAETQLRRSKEMLEELVQQRTLALREANEELENEINRRRGLEDQILEISDREQQRLAQELHDGLCQELTAIGFMARATAMRVKNHRVLEPEDMEQIATLVNRAANDARNISRALHRVDVDAAGFVEALQNLATKETLKVPCRVAIKKGFQIADHKTAINLYGIAREAVMNANKHAQASEIVIHLSKSKGEIVLTIADDGVGLKTSPKHSPGMGFHIMDYRARSIGGRLEVESRKDAGTRISCYLPV